MFAEERTLDALADAGYQNGFEGLPLAQRVTHPRTHGFPDATFDFIFSKGLAESQPKITRTNASDHWPVTRNFRLPCRVSRSRASVKVAGIRIEDELKLVANDADLFQEGFFVGAPPTLDHLAVFKFGDLHSADFDLLTGGRDLSERSTVRAGKRVSEGDGVLVLYDRLGLHA